MGSDVPLLLFLTSTCSMLAAVASVLAVWKLDSRSTPRKKQPPSEQPTQPSAIPSESQMAALAADQAALYSTLEKLTTTVKRLSSRQGMRDARARDGGEAPPQGTSKAELLRYYGMTGKVGPAFAQAQLDLEAKRNTH